MEGCFGEYGPYQGGERWSEARPYLSTSSGHQSGHGASSWHSSPSLLRVAITALSAVRRTEVVKLGSQAGGKSREAARPETWKIGVPAQLQWGEVWGQPADVREIGPG